MHSDSLKAPDSSLPSQGENLLWLKDVEGRPIGENRAPAECLRGVEAKMVHCPYGGSRSRTAHPMNLSALQQVSNHWREALDGIRSLRSQYINLSGGVPPQPIDLWLITHLGTSLPSYLHLRTGSPYADGSLPSVVATIFKLSDGIRGAFFALFVDWALRARSPSLKIDLNEFYDLIEGDDILIGESESCAGSPKMIREALEAFLEGEALETKDGFDVFASLAIDWNRFLGYARAVLQFKIVNFLFRQLSHWIVSDLCSLRAKHGSRGIGAGELELNQNLQSVATCYPSRLCPRHVELIKGVDERCLVMEIFLGLLRQTKFTEMEPVQGSLSSLWRSADNVSITAVPGLLHPGVAKILKSALPEKHSLPLAKLLGLYLDLEERMLRCLSSLQNSMSVFLEREKVCLSPEILMADYARTPRDVFRQFL